MKLLIIFLINLLKISLKFDEHLERQILKDYHFKIVENTGF